MKSQNLAALRQLIDSHVKLRISEFEESDPVLRGLKGNLKQLDDERHEASELVFHYRAAFKSRLEAYAVELETRAVWEEEGDLIDGLIEKIKSWTPEA